MDTHVIPSLDTRRCKKDGSFPIILRLTHNRKTTSISTGYSVPEKYWDEKKRKIRPSYSGFSNVTRVNNKVDKEKSKAIDIITKLSDKGELRFLSIQQLKNHVVGSKKSARSVFKYTQKIIDDLQEKNKVGNARSYRNVLRTLKKFRNDKDFSFDELNYDFLLRFENDYLSRGNSENGLAVYMRTFRAIYNKAIKEGIADKEGYPFSQYSIKMKPTQKRAISYEAIQKIIVLKLRKKDPMFHARNYFLISFYLMGAPFINLAFLKMENIVDGRIRYKRRKTGRFYDIRINPNLEQILAYYTKGKKATDYILPIIKRESLTDQYKDVHWALLRYNRRLKEIGKKVGIEEKLSSYVSRHSFASIANNMEIPVTAISEMLGHERLSTTQIYLAGFKKEAIDQYAERVTNQS